MQFNEGSNFDRAGQICVASYLGDFVVSGEIVESRVKYGGKIQHTIQTHEETMVFNEIRPAGSHFLVEESNLLMVI